jgi:hypothetical protein
MTGKKRLEMAADPYRTDAWPTPTVRNAKRFVQVEVTHICAELTRTSMTN